MTKRASLVNHYPVTTNGRSWAGAVLCGATYPERWATDDMPNVTCPDCLAILDKREKAGV